VNARVQQDGRGYTAMKPVPRVTMEKDVVCRASVLMEQTATVSLGPVSVPQATL
ncbi:hypothetical protein M9458_036228, partial [Cirrhinus mrigala]